MSWSFRQFVKLDLAAEGTRIADAPVWMGDAQRVGLVAPRDLSVLVPAVGGDGVTAEVVFEGPVEAPIAAGDPIAELVVARAGMPEARLPLVAERDVARGGLVPRLRTAGMVLIDRAMGEAQALF